LIRRRVLTLNAAITRWTFQRSFIEYIAEQELDTISAAAANLATAYQEAGSWDEISRLMRLVGELHDLTVYDEGRQNYQAAFRYFSK